MANRQLKTIEEFPLSPKDILSSLDVFGMSSHEFGIYCKILFVSWIQPQQCFIRYDEHNLCELCNITPEEWEQCKAKILRKFKVRESGTGETFIYNERLYTKYREIVDKEKKNKGRQLSITAEVLNYPFEDFWRDYDKKVGSRDRLVPKWLKLSDGDREAIKHDIPLRKAAQPNKQYRPNPETYINGRLWENEIIDYRKNGAGNSKENKPGGYNAEGLSSLNKAIEGMQGK